jgi:hypothetical protein
MHLQSLFTNFENCTFRLMRDRNVRDARKNPPSIWVHGDCWNFATHDPKRNCESTGYSQLGLHYPDDCVMMYALLSNQQGCHLVNTPSGWVVFLFHVSDEIIRPQAEQVVILPPVYKPTGIVAINPFSFGVIYHSGMHVWKMERSVWGFKKWKHSTRISF